MPLNLVILSWDFLKDDIYKHEMVERTPSTWSIFTHHQKGEKKRQTKQKPKREKRNWEGSLQFGPVGNRKLVKIIYTTKDKDWLLYLYSTGFLLTATSAEMHQVANLHGFNQYWAQTSYTCRSHEKIPLNLNKALPTILTELLNIKWTINRYASL